MLDAVSEVSRQQLLSVRRYRDSTDLARRYMLFSLLTVVDSGQATGFKRTSRREGQQKANCKSAAESRRNVLEGTWNLRSKNTFALTHCYSADFQARPFRKQGLQQGLQGPWTFWPTLASISKAQPALFRRPGQTGWPLFSDPCCRSSVGFGLKPSVVTASKP